MSFEKSLYVPAKRVQVQICQQETTMLPVLRRLDIQRELREIPETCEGVEVAGSGCLHTQRELR